MKVNAPRQTRTTLTVNSAVYLFFTFLLFQGITVSSAFAQALESEMRSFAMPPARGFAGEHTIRYTGDYYYPYASDYVATGVREGPDTYTYYKLTGIYNKKVQIWPQVANLSSLRAPYVDEHGRTRDSCGHVHLSYGVWVKYVANVILFKVNHYEFVGGGGMSGIRNSSGRCTMEADGPLSRVDSRYGWGDEFTSIVPRSFAFNVAGISLVGAATEVIVGVTAPSHGWNTCGTFQCFQPVRPYVWTLRP